MNQENRDFTEEFTFKTSRSGGKGGQHANKVESRVTLFFDLEQSLLLSEEERQLLKRKWSNKLSGEEVLQITVETSRSQQKNKEIAIEKFYELLKDGLRKPKKRKKSKPSKSAIKKSIQQQKQKAEKKQRRRNDKQL